MNNFYSNLELRNLNFKAFGRNDLVSKSAKFYSPDTISIGNNVRIDDFCILSGKIKIGNNVHISAGVFLYGGDVGIEILDNVNISSKCVVFAVSDDFSNSYYIGPMSSNPEKRTLIKHKIIFKANSALGAMSVVLPGGELGEGTTVGAMSLVKSVLDDWTVYCGIPCQPIKKRAINKI